MTAEKLQEILRKHKCSGTDAGNCSPIDDCAECRLAWLRKPAEGVAENDTSR